MPGYALEECETKIRLWLNELQTTRKCSSTNSISKLVNLLKPADQQQITLSVTEAITKLCDAKESRREAVNVLNGCFDNFPAAGNAVSAMFTKVVGFLTDALQECWEYFRDGSTLNNLSHKDVVDLVHSISRVGTLIFKSQRGKLSVEDGLSFKRLSIACSDFILYVEDIAMDTKINLSMILWLMREICFTAAEDLQKLHNAFVETLASDEGDYNSKFLKFVMSSAAVNLWENVVINEAHTLQYLSFFLSLCENHGTETGLLLMVCRSLQTLAKHPEFLTNSKSNSGRLVGCLNMLLEHSIPCIRHSGRDLLQVLVRIRALQEDIQKAVLATSPDKKSLYLGLAALAPVRDVRNLIQSASHVPGVLIASLDDPTSVPHVILAIENLAINDSYFWENEHEWIDLWVMPLLEKLPKCLPIVAAQIEKLLMKLFKDKPDAIYIILEYVKLNKSPESLKWIMVCFKIRNQIKADGFELFNQVYSLKEIEMVFKHSDDDTRLGALSLLVDGVLTGDSDLQRVIYFLKYNLNNHRPATRQRVISLFKRLIVRVFNCCKVISRSKNPESSDTNLVSFLKNLIDFCYGQIFAEANFNRLNTVLNILDICWETLDSGLIARCGLFDAKHWASLQRALCSTYEENQIIAAKLAKNLAFAETNLNQAGNLRQDLRVAFGHIQALEPPRVLLGTYTLYVLLHVPNAGQVLRLYFCDCIENPSNEPLILCIQILSRYLKLQVNDAEENAVKAARDAPMYGTMFAIRLMLKQLQENHLEMPEAKVVLQELVEQSFRMADVVSPVVNNSSPEGHLPMDFQNIAENDDETGIIDNFDGIREKCKNGVDTMIEAYKTAETAEEKLFLADKIRTHYEQVLDAMLTEEHEVTGTDFNAEGWYKKILDAGKLLAEYDCYYKFFQCHLPRIIEEPPITAQALLLYSWRSMKEASLFLGDLVSKTPLKQSLECQILTEDVILKIGHKLRLLLSEIKHRGAFEQAEVGLSALCRSLWDCPLPSLHHLPSQWLKEILDEIVRPPGEQTLKLTSTRRSAGVPFLVQAILTTEIASNSPPKSQTFNATMKILLEIAEGNNLEAKLHGLNIMRSLFQNAQLAEFVFPFISKALEIAIYGSRSVTWSERNCSNMLFRALIVRIFGVSRSRDQLSKKNKMKSTTFFQRFPELYDVLYGELARADAETANGVKPEPSLYLVLLLMGRLYPPLSEDLPEVNLNPFLSLMARCAANPIMRIRVYAARALVPFVPPHELKPQIIWRLNVLKQKEGVRTNLRHGLLLQITQLVTELKNLKQDVEDIDWSLIRDINLNQPFPILHAIFQLGLILNDLSNSCADYLTANLDDIQDLCFKKYSPKQGVGVDACLATLTLLKLGCKNRSPKAWEALIRFKDCPVKTVQNTIFHFLYLGLTSRQQYDSDYNFSLVENEVKRISLIGETIPKNIWSWYCETEDEKFATIADIQQRQLRVLILARLIQLSKVDYQDDLYRGLSLLFLFSCNWEPESGRIGVAHCLTEQKQSIAAGEELLARIGVRVGFLLNGDKSCRLAVASVFNIWRELLSPTRNLEELGIEYRKYWLTLFRLLVDEDEDVRNAALETVHLLDVRLKNINEKASITSLAGQELLIQCYEKQFPSWNLGVDFLLFAILTILPPQEDASPTDFMEIFKKGNPNPFSETIALTALFIEAARSHLKNEYLENAFAGGADTTTCIYNLLSPHFALNGLRMKLFQTPIQLLSELRRLEPPDHNADNIVFWRQVQLLLTLVS